MGRMNKKDKKIKNKETKINVSFNLVEVIVITLMTAVIVSLCTGVLVFKNYSSLNQKYSKEKSSALEEFLSTYDHIIGSYVEEINEDELVDSAIKGLFNYLEDKNSNYIDEDTTVSLQEKLKGSYTGVGIAMIDGESGITITEIFNGSPASKVGLKVDDIIIGINDEDLSKKKASYVSEKMKDKADTFNLKVKRGEEELTFKITTKEVNIPSVSSDIIDGIGYMYIETFSATTGEQFAEKLELLEKENIDSLIIDVRYNAGGYLSSAYNIADLFIEKGKIIYQLKNKEGKIDVHTAQKDDKREYPIMVLINETSASASEVLASALKESYGAKILGVKSYGKGTVQETQSLTSGAMIKYTTAYWLTPSGTCVNEIGITPDYEVPWSYEDEEDTQLNKALEYIKEM